MLLAQDPSILLVDEPIAGMTHQETERTAELLQSLARQAHRGRRRARHGLHPQHRQTVTVLHQGKRLARGRWIRSRTTPR
jgi:urea transport system ATP-binding protein